MQVLFRKADNMAHRRSVTSFGQPQALLKRRSLARGSTDYVLSTEADEVIPKQRVKDIKQKLKVVPTQSIKSLVEELDCEDSPTLKIPTTPEPYLLPSKEDRDLLRVSSSNYRDLLALRLTETHDHLDKLMWEMQDALDSIAAEGQKQGECLVEIGDLIDGMRRPESRKVEKSEERQSEDLCTRDTVTPTPPLLATSPLLKSVETADKSTQAAEAKEEVVNLGLLENRHCAYMFEAFHHLRFALEIVSPVEVDRPEKSQPIPESSSKPHIEHRLRLKGTIRELNQQLVEIAFRPTVRTAGNLIVQRGKTSRPTIRPLLSPRSTPKGFKSPFSAQLLSDLAAATKPRASTVAIGLGETIILSLNLRLKTTAPFQLQQTRPLPQYFRASTKVKYAEIEHIQTIMPEIADLRFNISDVISPEMPADEFYLSRYFSGLKDYSEAHFLKVEENITSSLHIFQFLLRHRKYLRLVFISYNMEAMSNVSDLLCMAFPSFIKFLKDCLLISPAFDLLAAAKVFYLSAVKSKEMPKSEGVDGERQWFKHLLNSYNFTGNYRLKLSGFLESIVRLTYYHPRFQRLTGLSHRLKLDLLYKRYLKPNARLTQGSYYCNLLRDIHVIEVLKTYEQGLYEIFQGYESRLTTNEKLMDYIGKDKKMDLHKYYAFLGNSGYLIQADIISIGNEDIEQEINRLNDLQAAKPQSPASFLLRPNQPYHIHVKETTIRFPSSLIDRVENANMKLKAVRNTRHQGSSQDSVLLPFHRPMRSTLQVDKLTAFAFFVSVMKSCEGVYIQNPGLIGDSEFCIDFGEFTDLIGMLGMLYWKTVSNCEGMSLVEGIATFIKSLTEKFRHHTRHFLGFSRAEKQRLSLSLVRGTATSLGSVQTKPVITKTMVPQDRFLPRRESI